MSDSYRDWWVGKTFISRSAVPTHDDYDNLLWFSVCYSITANTDEFGELYWAIETRVRPIPAHYQGVQLIGSKDLVVMEHDESDSEIRMKLPPGVVSAISADLDSIAFYNAL